MNIYHGQFLLDKFLNENYIKNIKYGFFVEAGAYDGKEESTCLYFEENLGWEGINIEPVPEIFNQLEINRPDSININIALSDKKEKRTFKHIIHPERGIYFGNGSLEHTEEHLKDLLDNGCSTLGFEVNCNSFKNIFNTCLSLEKRPPIDLFVLDIEGGELKAIDGILRLPKIYYPELFCIEYTHCGLDNLSKRLNNIYIFSSIYENNAIYLRKW
jgi:FkbM family methyltransferase